MGDCCRPVGVQTRVLKLHPNCVECQRKVKQAMERLHGMHSVRVDAREGKIEVTSTIDPRELISTAAKAVQRAELLWEPRQGTSRSNGSNFDHHVDHSLPPSLAQIHALVANNRRIRHAELVHQRSLKMTFDDAVDCGRASPVASNARSSPSPSPSSPLPSPASSRCGRRESSGSGAAAGGSSPAMQQNHNSQHVQHSSPARSTATNVNCGDEARGCRVM